MRAHKAYEDQSEASEKILSESEECPRDSEIPVSVLKLQIQNIPTLPIRSGKRSKATSKAARKFKPFKCYDEDQVLHPSLLYLDAMYQQSRPPVSKVQDEDVHSEAELVFQNQKDSLADLRKEIECFVKTTRVVQKQALVNNWKNKNLMMGKAGSIG